MNINKILGLLFLSLIFLIPLCHSVESQNLTEYYKKLYIGEKKTSNYYGPLDPRSEVTLNGLVLLDDIFKEEYLNEQLQEAPFSLHKYWFDEIVEKSSCPDSTLNENMDYIRYLYRLANLSYLFEGMKLNNKVANQIGGKNICSITFKDVFLGCTPKSSDMNKFYERVYGKFVNEIDKTYTTSFTKKQTSEWLSLFHSTNSLTTDPVYSRLHDWCILNKRNCRDLSLEEIKQALDGFCNEDKKMMKMICSEKDNFYGLSAINTPSELIKSSNAFNLINQTGMGEECLRRYSKLFKSQESSYSSLTKQYPLLYSYLLRNKTTYLQGQLFLPGALKEFDMKGLSDFLNALKPPSEEVVVVIKPKPIPKPRPVVVVAPKVEEKVVVVEPVVIIEPERPKVSEFERGVLELKEKNLSTYTLNMEKFRDDFEFTPAMIAELSGPIKKFQTRSALNDMKSYDLLGKEEAPVGLVFLKFLIDTENHQGLYNIITVLGNKFFVSNDIENKTTPYYIELKNDPSTNNRWTIIILKK